MNIKILFALIFSASSNAIAFAEITLHPLFTDGMVLQRGINIPIRGEGEAGAELKLQFHDQTRTTSVGQDGRWSTTLDPIKASSTPAELRITAGISTVTVADIIVGDVWLCSGQSNMGLKLSSCTGGKEAAEEAKDTLLRVNNHRDSWRACVEKTAAQTSGVAFFFARKLRQDNPDVPVGIIVRALSGTPIEAWTPVDSLKKIDFCRETLARFSAESEEGKKVLAFRAAEAEWKRARRKNGDDRKAAGSKPKFDGTAEEAVLGGIYVEGQPGRLWEERITSVAGYGIKGAVWYQGERNTKAGQACAAQYENMLPAMITAWRDAWGLGDFRFLAVQLPPFTKGGANWTAVQNGQISGVSRVKNADCIDTSDLPDGGLHPKDKRPIGERLAAKASD